MAGSDGCRIQRGGGSHQVLLLFSKNDHKLPSGRAAYIEKVFI